MRKKKLSATQKRLLCAFIGSSLFWHTPVLGYGEESPEAVPATGHTTEEKVAKDSGQYEFNLEGIEVTAKRLRTTSPIYAGGQVARESNLGVLGNRDFMDTPFSITSYTSQAIEDRQASTLQDILRSDSSVRFGTSDGHIMENFTIRGLTVNNEYIYFNGMAGLAPQGRVPLEFVDRVEVLKGPAALLYGGVNASVGGAINLVPKRAAEEDFTTLTTDYTSQTQLGGHIDISRRFGEDKELGVRFNGVYKDGETEIDDQSKKRLLGSLAIDYTKDKWRTTLDAYGSQESYDNGSVSMYNFYQNSTTKQYSYSDAPDGSTNLLKGAYGTIRNNAFLFKTEYDLQDNITAYASIGKLASTSTGYITGNHIRSLKSDGTATINLYNQYLWTDTTSADFGIRTNYQTGSVKHQLNLGYSQTDTDSASTYNSITGIQTNLYNPTSLASYYSLLSTPSRPNKTSETNLSSLFFGDTLSFDKAKTELTLGLRKQNVETYSYALNTGALTSSYESDATTPVIGLVVKPWGDSVSFYANYIEALSPGTVVSNTSYSNYGQVLAPYRTKQQEVGVKWDQGKFANTLAFFQINKPNSLVENSVQSYDGEQRHEGVEWNTFGNVSEHVRLLGGITYLDAKVTRAASNQGKVPYGTPRWLMNAGAEWDTPWNRDLTLSLLAVYTGTQYADSGNTVKLPSSVRFDLGARYKTTVDHTPVTFRANVENIFNKHYWSGAFSDGYVTLGGPRTFKLSATWNL